MDVNKRNAVIKTNLKVWMLVTIASITVAGYISDATHSTSQTSSSLTNESTPHQHTHTKIAYTLDWGWGNAQADQTQGWHVTNNLGYDIHITDGTLVNAAVQLVPCVDSTRLFAPQTAHAGHGGGKPDETRWVGPLVESLSKPGPIALGSVEIGDHRYCQAHYLLAQNELKNGFGIVALEPTIVLTGTYISPNGGAPVAFRIKTNIAWGGATDLPKAIVNDSGTEQAPHSLTLVRNLGMLLDGVDLAAMTPDQQARTVLRSLTTQIQVVQH